MRRWVVAKMSIAAVLLLAGCSARPCVCACKALAPKVEVRPLPVQLEVRAEVANPEETDSEEIRVCVHWESKKQEPDQASLYVEVQRFISQMLGEYARVKMDCKNPNLELRVYDDAEGKTRFGSWSEKEI